MGKDQDSEVGNDIKHSGSHIQRVGVQTGAVRWRIPSLFWWLTHS